MVAPAIKLAVRIVAQVRLIGSSLILGIVGESVRLSLSIGRFSSGSLERDATMRNSVPWLQHELFPISPKFPKHRKGGALWVLR